MTYQFDTEDAKLFGADGAAILWHIRFWVRKNKANGRNRHEVQVPKVDGTMKTVRRYFTYNSREAMAELFPWLSVDQIRRHTKKLVEAGVLITHQVPGYDRTLWYGFMDERQLDVAEPPTPSGENAKWKRRDRQMSSDKNTRSEDQIKKGGSTKQTEDEKYADSEVSVDILKKGREAMKKKRPRSANPEAQRVS